MKDGFIKAAACTPQITVGNPDKNADEIIRLAKKAAKDGAKIIAFPELSVTGATCGDAFFQQQLIKDAALAMEKIRQGTRKLDALIIFGLPIVFNPYLLIPFVLVPLIALVMTYASVSCAHFS